MADEVDGKLQERLRRYCALQDRSEVAFRRKARDLGLTAEEVDSLLGPFRDQGFLDDERFAASYVRAHIREKRWGPVKLAHGLREHGMDAATIERVVGGEADRVWQENLQTLIAQRPPAEDEADRARLLRWLLGKGYRTEQILQALDDAASRRTFAAHDHD